MLHALGEREWLLAEIHHQGAGTLWSFCSVTLAAIHTDTLSAYSLTYPAQECFVNYGERGRYQGHLSSLSSVDCGSWVLDNLSILMRTVDSLLRTVSQTTCTSDE